MLWKFTAMERIVTKGAYRNFTIPLAALILFFLGLCPGCGNKFFDPTQIGRFRPVPAVNVILDSLGVAEEAPAAWEGAEEPLPVDTVVRDADYEFMPGDVISISIFELLREGVNFVSNFSVTESGRISIPEVGIVQASGLSETELEEEIKKKLSPNILKNPVVTVTLLSSQQRAFSVLGDGVPLPGRYFLPRYDFRLTDALAMAGSPSQYNVSYVYVSRSSGANGSTTDTINPGYGELELKAIGPSSKARMDSYRQNSTTPQAEYRWPQSKVVIASSEMIAGDEYPELSSGSLQSGNYNSGLPYSMSGTRQPNSNRGANTQQSNNQQTSVDEILRTLSERSRRDMGSGVNTALEDTLATQRQPYIRQGGNNDRLGFVDRPRTYASAAATQTEGSGPETGNSENIEWIFRDGQWISVPVDPTKPLGSRRLPETRRRVEEPAAAAVEGQIEWIFQDGKWVPVQIGPGKPAEPVIKVAPEQQLPPPSIEKRPSPELAQDGAETRLIRIPVDKLLAGDPRYNIVIKPSDTIFVPVDIVGEFSIMGNVNRTGYIPLTGRPMTLKQAIAAAGGLGPLAWPKRCEVIRRIGRNKEEIAMVDLDKIASGEQPDFFIKPHDQINVGTHETSRWRAILRNAFRATYGFGFVYDRNFADRDFGTSRPIPNWF